MMDDTQISKERLYVIRPSLYVQYSGNEELPKEIVEYVRSHRGELPPFMPLPESAVEFELPGAVRSIYWPGRGPLPAQVLRFVEENGVLPPRRLAECGALNEYQW